MTQQDARPSRPEPSAADGGALRSVVGTGAAGLPPVRAVYQPVVELDSLAVVGYEALARGPQGSAWEDPTALFAEARASGLVPELDWSCRLAAFEGALAAGLPGRLGLFVNVEPGALGAPPPVGALELLDRVGRELPVVLEITERALAADLAGLLRGAQQARERGWRVAVDDVGAEQASLALLPFLRPEVIKLDLRLVQAHASLEVAEIITAVNAHAERTGALVLAEGIETEDHARLARMMGATLGQGWLFGRPGPLPTDRPPPAASPPPAPRPANRSGPSLVRPSSGADAPGLGQAAGRTPFSLVSDHPGVRRATKPLLLAISRQLERQALSLGEGAVVLATFQSARHFSPTTARRYAALASACSLTVAFAAGFGPEPAADVRGVDLGDGHPLCGEWDVVVVGPHFAAALLTRDLGDGGPDSERRFDYRVVYDRDVVLAAADLLLPLVPARDDMPPPHPDEEPTPAVGVDPTRGGLLEEAAATGGSDGRTGPVVDRARPSRTLAPRAPGRRPSAPGELQAVLAAAGVGAPHGISVADARHPDLPLVWVNNAFLSLTGYKQEEVLDRNCRFLQGERTDPEVVRGMRRQLRAGRVARATLLNYRRDRSTFWNDLQITPVHDAAGELTHYVGQQHDITEQVDAQRRAHHLAYHDELTGLANRAQLRAHLAAETARADRSGTAVALLYLDLDRFKAVNDTLGHAAGDELLTLVAARLHDVTRAGDLLARLGGDEFLLVLSGLREQPQDVAVHRARDVLAALTAPMALPDHPGREVTVGASVGISLYPADAGSAEELLDHADQAMYGSKAAGRQQVSLWSDRQRH